MALLTKPEVYIPQVRDFGTALTIMTEDSSVCFWACWRKAVFHLAYSNREQQFPLNEIQQILGADTVDETVTSFLLKDETQSKSEWNRVKVGEDDYPSATPYPFVDSSGTLRILLLSQSSSSNIYTPPFRNNAVISPEATYAKFLKLAVEISEFLGTAQSVSLSYGLLLKPEELESLGYVNVEYYLAEPDFPHSSYRAPMYRAQRETDSGIEELRLKFKNAGEPWYTYRKVDCSVPLTTDFLESLLMF